MRVTVIAVLLIGLVQPSSGFVAPGGRLPALARQCAISSSASPQRRVAAASASRAAALRMSSDVTEETAVEDKVILTAEQLEKGPGVPSNENEMVNTAAAASRAAMKDGITRQKLRFLLPRDGKLNPTDEDWPGGIMELYAACSPLTRSFLRKLSSTSGGVGATCTEQRLDESGVDGVSLWTAQGERARDDMSAFCQPSGEQIEEIKMISQSAGPRLVLLVNPQWRETLDSYDELGKKGGFLGQLGNFLGGTSGTRAEIEKLGYKDTYLIQQFVVRGDDVNIVKCYPYPDWYAYSENDDGKMICLGKQATRPTYQEISDMFEEKGVAMKWAREAGIGKEFKE